MTGFQGSTRLGNYHIDPDTMIKKRAQRQTFIVGFSCAYNAFGLIGSEVNGIVVLNDTKKDVVLDEHLRADSGYFGPGDQHRKELERLKGLKPKEFMDFIGKHPRARKQYATGCGNG